MIVWILAGAALCLVALLLVLRGTMGALDTRRGKIFALLAMGLLPMLWLLATLVHDIESMETVDFCIQCHTMVEHGESLDVEDADASLASAHYQNNRVNRETACYDCHVVHTPAGIIKAKINGLKEAYIEYLGSPEKPEEMKKPYDTVICLSCHGEAKDFLETHEGTDQLEEIRSGKVSCVTECHDVAHTFEEEDAEDE